VPQPKSDNRDINAGLEEMHSCRVSDCVRRDGLLEQTRMIPGSYTNRRCEALRHVGSGHGRSTPVREQVGVV
jgi:hypothetical protein